MVNMLIFNSFENVKINKAFVQLRGFFFWNLSGCDFS